MLYLLILRNAQCVKHIHQLLGTEETHQIVFQRNVETGFTRISLTSGTPAQLIVDTSGFMTLGTDDLETADFLRLVVQLDIRTTAGHVGSDGYRAVYTGIGYNLSLHLMEFGIQHLVRHAAPCQHLA